jgi:hypothetical protein
LWWTGFLFFLTLNAWFLPGYGGSSLWGHLAWVWLKTIIMCIRECMVLFCYHRIISVSIFFSIWRFFYLVFNLVLVVVFLTLIFITAVTPVLSDQGGAVLGRGGHVLSRYFRYYVPDFAGKVLVQTPIIVRWVLI